MPLCESLALFVDITMAGRTTVPVEDDAWATAIRSIAFYRERGRLDEWESDVNRMRPAAIDSPLRELLAELEMLGMCNLYQAFNTQRTSACYSRLLPFFEDRGVTLPEHVDLSGW